MLCASLWCSAGARAQAFEIKPELAGVPLGTHMGVLRDPTGALDIHQVASAQPQRFVVPRTAAPSFGLDESNFWIRLPVSNPTEHELRWLLEVGYPHLDWIDLYVPRLEGGFDVRHTGDNTRFSTRDLESRMFVFKLNEPAKSGRVYYLRVRTSGSVSLPLRAWSADAYHAHEAYELPMLWMFYGVILVMAVYNLFLFFSSRLIEYLHYSLYNLSFMLMQFALNGHAFQYFLRDDIFLANHVLAFAVGLTYIFVAQFARTFLCIPETIPWLDRYYRILTGCAMVTTTIGLLGPFRIRFASSSSRACCISRSAWSRS